MNTEPMSALTMQTPTHKDTKEKKIIPCEQLLSFLNHL